MLLLGSTSSVKLQKEDELSSFLSEMNGVMKDDKSSNDFFDLTPEAKKVKSHSSESANLFDTDSSTKDNNKAGEVDISSLT
jgi:hypothetical protein